MVMARKVFTARGDVVLTEAGDGCCIESEEISAVEVEVPYGTCCDICGETIPYDDGDEDEL